MPREVPNQKINGIELSERSLFLWLTNNLGEASDAARGLAHARKDMRWLAISKMLEEIKQKATLVMNKPAGLIIPRR